VSVTEGPAAVSSFIGAALVARSPGSTGGVLGAAIDLQRYRTLRVAAALLAALASAIWITLVRRLHTSFLVFFNAFNLGVCCTVIATLLIVRGKPVKTVAILRRLQVSLL
jgi:hypothetical protein